MAHHNTRMKPHSLPSIKLLIAFLAILMFRYDPRMWIFLSGRLGGADVVHLTGACSAATSAHVSARTILVLVTFSMVNLVFPPLPATRPMALERWSPRNILTVCVRSEAVTAHLLLGTAGTHRRSPQMSQ